MKINEIVLAPWGWVGTAPVSTASIRLWLPSDAVRVVSFSWPGRLHRYRVWQRVRAEPCCQGMFNFEQHFDVSQQKTHVSVMHIDGYPWMGLPFSADQIDHVTAPNIMVNRFLPKQTMPFSLLAYRWLGRLELCAYQYGLLRHADSGLATPASARALWSRVVQTMPVLAAAPLYSLEGSVTALFQPHHGQCITLPAANHVVGRIFKRMREGEHELTD